MADCKIIYKDNERVGVEDDNGQPSTLFQDILSNPQIRNFDEALLVYKQTKSDEIGLPTETEAITEEYFTRNADRLPLTLAVFNRPEFKDLQGRMVNPQTVTNYLNQTGIKQIEKDLIKQIIQDNYQGQKKISYDELEATVRANLMPLERITTSSYADYGMDNLGRGDYGQAKTLILNAPIEHGVTGHFSGDFKASGRQNIKYVPKKLNDNVWVAVEEGYESQANDNNIYQYVGTAGTKEAVDAWINNYENETKFANSNYIVYEDIFYKTKDYNNNVNPIEGFQTKQEVEQFIKDNNSNYNGNLDYLPQSDYSSTLKGGSINKGMFGHIRVWQDGEVMTISELQSDYFQKNNARKEILEKNKDYKNAKVEYDIELKDIQLKKDLFFTDYQNLFLTELEKMDNVEIKPHKLLFNDGTKSDEEYLWLFVNGDPLYKSAYQTNSNYSFEVQRTSIIKGKNLKGLVDELGKETLEKIDDEVRQPIKPLEKDIKTAQKKFDNAVENIIKGLSPQEKQFIASQKIWEQRMVREAIKEASLSNATSLRLPTPYTLSVIEGYLSEGAPYEIENANDSDSLEVGDRIYYVGEDYTVVDSDSTTITIAESGRVSSSLDEDIISQEVDNSVDNDMYEIENNLKDFYTQEEWNDFRDNYSPISSTELDEVGNEIEEGVFEVSEGKIRDIVTEYYKEIFTDAEDIIRDMYGSDVWVSGNTVTWTDGTANVETLMQPSEYKGQGTKDNFSIEDDLDDTQQTVARKYEEIAEILKKEKPVEIVTDENGFDWYETKISPEEINNPVVVYSTRTVEPSLKYQTKDGKVFQSYSEALKNTTGDSIEAGVNTTTGFKTLFEVQSNTNINSLGGMINTLIKNELLSDQSFLDVDGNTYLVPEGANEAKKQINADLIKSLMQKTLGSRSVSISADGNIKIDKNIGKIQIDENKFVTPQELKVDFKTLKKEFGMEKAVEILTAQVFNEETSIGKKADVKEEFVPENLLQEKIVKLLKDMGIKTLSFEEYKKQYTLKNGIEPSASALADVANKLIAFRDGVITEDDLLEETAHIIEASIPQADKENILRNIHKTKEWAEHYDNYMRIYEGNEALVRKEVLGKIIANGLKTQFEARNQNQTEDSILARLKELVLEFFDRIVAYINPTIESQLNTLNQQIYRNLMNDTLVNELGETQGNDTLFSAPNASPMATSIYINTKKILDRLTQQSQLLSKKYQSTSDRQILQKTKEALSIKEDEIRQMELIEAASNVVRVTSSQVNTLKKALESTKEVGYHFSSDENNVYISLKKDIRPILLQLKKDLFAEVYSGIASEDKQIEKQLALVQEEIKVTLEVLQELETIAPRSNEIALQRMVQRVKDKAGMTQKEGELYDSIIKASLMDNQKDTDTLHAHIGSLLQARNPLLNLAGDVIERTNLEKNSLLQIAMKPLINGLAALGVLSSSALKNVVKNGYVVNERDSEKVKQVDLQEKTSILSAILKGAGITEAVTTENVEERLKQLQDDKSEQGRNIRTAFNKAWSKTKKARYNSHRRPEDIVKHNNHPIKINGETYSKAANETDFGEAVALDDQYRSEISQIRINAGNSLTKEDQYRIKEVNKRRNENSNPRYADGSFIEGLTQVYDENLKRYVTVLADDIDALPPTQQNRARTIFGLNVISLINQDFYKKENEANPKGIPQSFIDALEALPTEEEKREFLVNNSYIGFPDSYWEQLSDNKSLVDRLREEGQTELLEDIRKQQSIISSILKQNRVFNRPSETNFNEMLKVHQLTIKDAQANIEELYRKARTVLDEVEATTPISESIVNEAYNTEVVNQKLDTVDKQLDFIGEHVTKKGKTSIEDARVAVENLKRGNDSMSKSLRKIFTADMSNAELDAALLNYAKAKLLPYFKKTEPIGFSENMKSMPVLDFIFDDSVVVTPSYSFYNSTESVNPDWLENNLAGKPQYTKEYLDKVRDDKYYEYFDLDEKGNRKEGSTKNQKEWEARKLLLDYIDQMIDYNELTGTQDRYMMPQVRKTATERFGNSTVEGVKQNLKDLITFRPEEAELGQTPEGDLAKSGSSLLTIPVYYNRELEDKTELTDNILYAYILYGQAAALHKARKDNIGDMLVLEDTLLGVDFKSKTAESSNAYKMLQSFKQANFYGVKETFSYEGTFLGKPADYGKLAKMVNSFFKWSNISGVVVPLTSLFQAQVQKTVETLVGEITNSSAAKVGNKYFTKFAGESAREIMGFTSNGFLNVIGEALGVYNMTERFENSQYSLATRGILKTTSGLHELGNFPVITRMFLSVMGDYRYVNGNLITLDNFKKLNAGKANSEIIREWEKNEVFLDDVIYATKEGVLDFTNPEFLKRVEGKMNLKGEALINELQAKKEQMSQKSLAAIQRIDTQIPEHQKSIAARDARANFFLSHLNYLMVQIPLKFKERQYMIAEETWQEGNWRTTFNFMYNVITKPSQFAKTWKETMGDDVARKNLKRTAIEMGVANTLVIACMLLSKYVDDDDDPAWAEAFADYMLTRVATEQLGSTVALPSSIGSVIENPIMAYSKMKDLTDVFYLFSDETIKAGTYKGDTKAYRLMAKQLWFMREYQKISDPKLTQDSYSYFSEEKKDLFDNYAILSNAFDEE